MFTAKQLSEISENPDPATVRTYREALVPEMREAGIYNCNHAHVTVASPPKAPGCSATIRGAPLIPDEQQVTGRAFARRPRSRDLRTTREGTSRTDTFLSRFAPIHRRLTPVRRGFASSRSGNATPARPLCACTNTAAIEVPLGDRLPTKVRARSPPSLPEEFWCDAQAVGPGPTYGAKPARGVLAQRAEQRRQA